MICNPCRCGRIPLLFKKGCPKGGVVIWKSSEFIAESMPFRGQETALQTGQVPLPRPTATPSPRKGNGPSAAAARCGRTLFTHLFFLLVFNMRNFYYLICNLCWCGRIPLLFKKGCPTGGVVIWITSEFLVESTPFRRQETALQTVQMPLPRPAATPSPRKGNCSSAPAAWRGRTLFTHLFFLLVFNMRNLYYLICNPRWCGRTPLLFKKGCPKGEVVIWITSEFLVESMPFRGQGTALLTGQVPLPRPTATPSPRKGNGASAPAARCASFFIVSIALAFIFPFISCKTSRVVFASLHNPTL